MLWSLVPSYWRTASVHGRHQGRCNVVERSRPTFRSVCCSLSLYTGFFIKTLEIVIYIVWKYPHCKNYTIFISIFHLTLKFQEFSSGGRPPYICVKYEIIHVRFGLRCIYMEILDRVWGWPPALKKIKINLFQEKAKFWLIFLLETYTQRIWNIDSPGYFNMIL